MKQVVSISLGPVRDDYEFETEFLGEDFHIRRLGTDGDLDKTKALLLQWNNVADAIGLGSVKFPFTIGTRQWMSRETKEILTLCSQMKTPVTTGDAMRMVGHEWSLRHIQHEFGNHYFDNAKVLFISGMANYTMAKVMSEYTENLTFADPVLENGISKFLHSIHDLELYAHRMHRALKRLPAKQISSSARPLRAWNERIMHKAMQKAHIIVVPSYDFYRYVENWSLEEIGGKVIITSTAYDDRIKFLKDRGVELIIDSTPKILKQVVGVNVLEAMIIAALGKTQNEVTKDDLLEIISDQRMDARVVYPYGAEKHVKRFAFVIHPLSQEDLKKQKTIDLISKAAPPGALNAVEKVVAYFPPLLYSKVTGIKSPAGVEAEGWLIVLGGTPKQMMAHSTEFTNKRLLKAAKMAKKLGAQIMGIGATTKEMGDAGETVAKEADIPVTTGNSYIASAALWATADAVRRMGLIKLQKGKILKAKTMVVGATGSVGSVCCHLLAKAFREVYMVDVRDARLLALKNSILEETPSVKLHISTRADKYLSDMDVIVTASTWAGNKVPDIMKVKPGCVICDVARPLSFSPEAVAKRPDVLVIESGEVELPGHPEMRDIGLPPRVAYAGLAETIVLALEGRFENFTIGRDLEWEKVSEIYKMGLKHGMKLAAINGVNGVFTEEDITRVSKLAIEARKRAS